MNGCRRLAVLTALVASCVGWPEPRPGFAAAAAPAPSLLVQFEGGPVGTNVSAVLSELVKGKYVETRTFPLEAGEGLCDVYRKKARLPGNCTGDVLDLAVALNPRARRFKGLPLGFEVVVPAVELEPYDYSVTLDPSVAADRARFRELTSFWKGHLQRQEKAPNGADRLVFQGYGLVVPLHDDAALAELRKRMRKYQSPNVILTPAFRTPPPVKLYALKDQFWEACRDGTPFTTGMLDLGGLIGATAERCPTPCAGPDCAEVVVVDTAVSRHPDLETSFGGLSQRVAYRPLCQAVFHESVHHGTHLAGIVAGDGGNGRIRGVDPGVPLASVVRDAAGQADATVAEEIETRSALGLPVFLFASRWQASPCRLRGAGNAIAMRVCDNKPLWIAAVGDEGQEITTAFPYGPMNLGDERNVVNVTACEDCEPGSPTPQILHGSNWSSSAHSMLHVAAPGKDIPAPVSTSEYGRASGTSQAAAFVAGVAAAMRNCYPSAYTWPHLVKTRLQATSRPFPPVAGGQAREDDGLAAGIVDAGTALLDPRSHWLRRRLGSWEAVRIRGWLRQDLSVLHPVTGNLAGPGVRPGDVLRLVRFVHRDPTQSDQWTVYSKVAWDDGHDHLGEVLRTGPGILSHTEEDVLELCSGEKLSLDDVEDVLIALNREPCP